LEGASIYLTPEIEDEPLLSGPTARRGRRSAQSFDVPIQLSPGSPTELEASDEEALEPENALVQQRPFTAKEQLVLLVESIDRALVEPVEMLGRIFEINELDLTFQSDHADLPPTACSREELVEPAASAADLRVHINEYLRRVNA
jgi:hypothetical protein